MVLNGLVRFLVAIYCTQILFQIFRNPIRPCHAPGNSCLISRSNSQRLENLGIKKGGTCRATRNDWKPQSSQPDSNHSVRFKSVRSGTKNNSLGKATFSSPSPLYSLYSRAYVVKQISRREFPVHHKKQPEARLSHLKKAMWFWHFLMMTR